MIFLTFSDGETFEGFEILCTNYDYIFEKKEGHYQREKII